MKTRARRNSGDAKASLVTDIASEEGETISRKPNLTVISNDGIPARARAGVRPKVHMSPKKVREAVKPVASVIEPRVSDPALSADEVETQTESVQPVETNESIMQDLPIPAASGSRFDVRIALGLVALVVAVNLMLLMLVGTAPRHAAPAAPAASAVAMVPAAEPVKAESGIVLRDHDLGNTQVVPAEPVRPVIPARPASVASAPVAAKPAAPAVKPQSSAPSRDLLSIINQY